MSEPTAEGDPRDPHEDQPQLDEAPVNPFFERWARLVLRHRGLAALATFALTGMFVYMAATKAKVDNSVEAFLASKSEARVNLERLRDDFGRDDMYVVLIEGDVFSMPYLERLQKLHGELAELNVPLESLGERRKVASSQPATKAEPAAKGAAEEAPAKAESAAAEEAPAEAPSAAAEDDFGDFGEEGDDAFGDFGEGGGASADAGFGEFTDDEGWGEEAGGSIIDEITSLINVRRTRWKNGGLEVGGLLDEWPAEGDLAALKAEVLADRTLVGQVVGEDARHSVIMIRTDFMSEDDSALVYDEIARIAKRYSAEGFAVEVAGMPALAAVLNRMMLGDMGRLIGIALLAMFLILVLMFRHPLGIVGPSLVVVQAAIWTFGLMALVGEPMTMVTNILPAFLICVGIGDSIHVQSVYRDARRHGVDNHEAIVHAVATTGIPVFFTTVTTAIGLMSFRFASLDAIQAMGTFGAFGVMAAFLHSVVFLPIVLSFNKKSLLGRKEARKNDLVDRLLAWCNGLSKRRVEGGRVSHARRRGTLIAALFVGVGGVATASMLAVYHDPLGWLPADNPVKQTFDDLDQHIGGTSDIALLVTAKEGEDLKDRELMLALAELEAHVRAYQHEGEPLVGNTMGVVDVVRESWEAVNGEDPKFYDVPPTDRGVTDMFTLFENSGPDQLRRLATVDMKRALVIMRVGWLDALSYKPLTEHLDAGISRIIGDKADVKTTGSVYNLFTVVSALLMDLLRSFGTAFGVITLMMMFLLKDVKLGLIAMVPNLLPIVVVMGFMGATGIPVDVNTLLIASIAIGIAVDDTIHFLHQFKSHFSMHGDVDGAIDHAYQHSGRALVMTSLVLVAGFLVYTAAILHNLQRFGLLVAMTVVLALFIDLIFTPAILRTFYKSGPQAQVAHSDEGVADADESRANALV